MARGKLEPGMRPWKKGESGNPAGLKPGTVQLKARLRQLLCQIPEGKDKTNQELLIMRMLSKAVNAGNEKLISLIWEAFEGKATQKHEVAATVIEKVNPEIKKLTQQLNAIYRANGGRSNGRTTGALGSQTSD